MKKNDFNPSLDNLNKYIELTKDIRWEGILLGYQECINYLQILINDGYTINQCLNKLEEQFNEYCAEHTTIAVRIVENTFERMLKSEEIEVKKMTSKEKIVDIKYLIMEHYSDKTPLEDYQKASRNCFFRYCDEIKQDLERLEQTLGKIEDILTDKYNREKYPFPDDVIDAISEVFDNETS